MTAPWQPPRDIWEVNRSLQLDEHLDGDRDPRWVDTERARGEYSLAQLCRALGVDRTRRRLAAPAHGYYLFCGHRGSGKSTELRRIAHELHDRDFYYVVFADAAQELDVTVTEDTLPGTGKGVRILFVIDGTDRLGGDDAHAFFAADVHQLQQVRALFVYCAPVHLAYEGANVGQNFSSIFRLPMIKLLNSDGSLHEEGRAAMREMLHLRAAAELFDAGVADRLIEHSGGHPRDLLRLLLNAFKHAEHDRFDDASAHRAVREMAADYRRILNLDDYRLLAAIDAGQPPPAGSERSRNLLYNLALLEYNEYFWRSHPVIRSTEEYMAAKDSLSGSDE